MRLNFFLGFLLFACPSFAQLTNGSIAPLFNATTTAGNLFQLEQELTQGRFVVLHFFACWDYSSWEYAQSGALNTLDSLYGAQGSNELTVLQIEVDSSNTTAQLSGPEILSGNNATQTFGDWNSILHSAVTESYPVAQLYQISYVPAIVVICPDRRIRNFDALPALQLYESIRENACPMPTAFANPSMSLINVNRDCGNNLIELSWTLQNQGLDTLFSVHIATEGLADTFSFVWNGILPPFTSDTLHADSWELESALPFQVFAQMPDSLADAHDSITISSGLGIATMSIQLELALDNYPEEISWEIRNDSDSVVFSGGNYFVPYEYVNTTFEMPAPGCYSFKLNDTSGDGLHGSQWSGYDGSCNLRSIDTLTGQANATLLAYDGSYNFSSTPNSPASLTAFFEAGSSLKTDEPDNLQPFKIFPNPAVTGSVLTVTTSDKDTFDCTLFTSDGRAYNHYSNNRNSCIIPSASIPAGIYLLLIQAADHRKYTHRIIIQ